MKRAGGSPQNEFAALNKRLHDRADMRDSRRLRGCEASRAVNDGVYTVLFADDYRLEHARSADRCE